MCEALDDHEGSVNVGERLITNFRFADDIGVNTEEEEVAGVLVDQHEVQNGDRSRQYKSDDKQPKWLPKRDQDKRSEARRSGENLKYIGAIISNEGSKPEIFSRIAQTTAVFV